MGKGREDTLEDLYDPGIVFSPQCWKCPLYMSISSTLYQYSVYDMEHHDLLGSWVADR